MLASIYLQELKIMSRFPSVPVENYCISVPNVSFLPALQNGFGPFKYLSFTNWQVVFLVFWVREASVLWGTSPEQGTWFLQHFAFSVYGGQQPETSPGTLPQVVCNRVPLVRHLSMNGFLLQSCKISGNF